MVQDPTPDIEADPSGPAPLPDPAGADAPPQDLPDDPAEAIELLQEALAEARQNTDAHLDDLKRLAADFENYRRRARRELDEVVELSSQRVVASLLPILDTFDQAFAHETQNPGEEQVLSGMRHTFHQLMEVLANEGLEMIPTDGDFDPAFHEAISGGGDGDLIVAEVVRPGYSLGGRVLRPAMVIVASAPDEEVGGP
jgi:molecular chaperone GrpE